MAEQRAGALLYHRISKTVFGDDADQIKRQIEDTRRLAENRELPILGTFTDSDESGNAETRRRQGKGQRPQLAKLIETIRAGTGSYVVAWKPDRLFRDVEDKLAFDRVLAERGVLILTYSGEFDPRDSNHKFISTVLAASDQKYADDVREKVERSLRSLREEGRPGGGVVGFGYRRGFRTLDVVEDEAALIRDAVDRLLAHRTTFAAIAREWTEKGVPTRRGGEWRVNNVSLALLSPRLAGLRTYNGEVIGTACWEPIISEDEYRRLRAMFGKAVTYRPGVARPLAGLLFCHACGKPLNTTQVRKRAKYACRKLGGCRKTLIDAEYLEVALTADVLARLDTAEFAAAIHAAMSNDASDVLAEIEEHEAELADLEANASRMKVKVFLSMQEGIEARLADARARLSAATDLAPLAAFAGKGSMLQAGWGAMTWAEQRKVFGAFIDRIDVGPGVPGSHHAVRPEAILKRLAIHPRPLPRA